MCAGRGRLPLKRCVSLVHVHTNVSWLCTITLSHRANIHNQRFSSGFLKGQAVVCACVCVCSWVGFDLIQTWNTRFPPPHTHTHPRLSVTLSLSKCVCEFASLSLFQRCVTAWLYNPKHICMSMRLSARGHEACKSIKLERETLWSRRSRRRRRREGRERKERGEEGTAPTALWELLYSEFTSCQD